MGILCIALLVFSTSIFPFLLGKMIDAAVPGTGEVMASGSQMTSKLGINLKDISWSLHHSNPDFHLY